MNARGERRKSKCSGVRVNFGSVKERGLAEGSSDEMVSLSSFNVVTGDERLEDGVRSVLQNVDSDEKNPINREVVGGGDSTGIWR